MSCGQRFFWWAVIPLCLSLLMPYLLILAFRVEFEVVPPEKALVLVTGTSSGLGRDMVRLLHSQGYSVLGSVRKQADADALEAEFASSAGPARVQAVLLDITKEADRTAAAAKFAQVAQAWNLVPYALINNAGGGKYKPAEITTAADDLWAYDSTVIGPTQLTRAVLPVLHKPGGRVLFIGSTMDTFGQPLATAYASTKAALHQYALILRRELLHQRISVSHIWQGPAASSFATAAFGKDLNPCTFYDELEGHASRDKYCAKAAEMIETFASLPKEGEFGYSLIDPIPCVTKAIDTLANPYPPPEVHTNPPGVFMVLVGMLPEIVKDKIQAL